MWGTARNKDGSRGHLPGRETACTGAKSQEGRTRPERGERTGQAARGQSPHLVRRHSHDCTKPAVSSDSATGPNLPPCVPAPECLLGDGQHLTVLSGHKEGSTPSVRCLPGGVVTCRAGPGSHPAGPLHPQSPLRAGEREGGRSLRANQSISTWLLSRVSAQAVWKAGPRPLAREGRWGKEPGTRGQGRAPARPGLLRLALVSKGQWRVASL